MPIIRDEHGLTNGQRWHVDTAFDRYSEEDTDGDVNVEAREHRYRGKTRCRVFILGTFRDTEGWQELTILDSMPHAATDPEVVELIAGVIKRWMQLRRDVGRAERRVTHAGAEHENMCDKLSADLIDVLKAYGIWYGPSFSQLAPTIVVRWRPISAEIARRAHKSLTRTLSSEERLIGARNAAKFVERARQKGGDDAAAAPA